MIGGEPTSRRNPIEIPWVWCKPCERPRLDVPACVDPDYLTRRFEEVIEDDSTQWLDSEFGVDIEEGNPRTEGWEFDAGVRVGAIHIHNIDGDR